MRRACLTTLLLTMLGGCSPEVGSDAWCEDLEEKPRGDWTMNEAADFARHCVFRQSGDD